MKIQRVVIFFVGFVLGGLSPAIGGELSDAHKRELTVEFAKIGAKQELQRLAELESELSHYSTSDKELVVFLASDLLSRKVLAIHKTRSERVPTAEHETTDALINGVSRLAELAQIASWPAAASCHVAELHVLTARRNGDAAEPANCRVVVYGREVQARYLDLSDTPRGKRLTELSNKWAASAAMLAYHMVDIRENGPPELVTTLAPKREEVRGICSNQLDPILAFPPEMQEAALFVASRRVLAKFVEVVSGKDANKEDRLWGYKILALGHGILKNFPLESERGSGLMADVASSTAQIIRGEIRFDAFRAKMSDINHQIDALVAINEDRKTNFFQRNMAAVTALSDCVVVHAIANASSKGPQ